MRKNRFLIKFLLAMSFFTHAKADNVIVLSLKHAPEEVRHEVEEEYKKQSNPEKIIDFKKTTPAEISQKMVKNEMSKYLTPSLSGFMIIYGGYEAISDQQGMVSFPLRHAADKVSIAITEEIKLIKVKENTFSHAEYLVNEQNQTKLYECEKKQDEKQQFFWKIKEIPLPQDNRIDPTTIIILSKPKNIFIPEGDFMTEKTAQLVLPDIYVLGNSDKESTLLKALELKQYLESIKIKQEKVSDTVTKKIITNI